MPTYSFKCKKCDHLFDDLCSWAESEKMRCPQCKKKAERLLNACAAVTFTNPGDTSKWDNFEYRAGWNMEKAKAERRAAEAAHKGANPYRKIDDSRFEGRIV